MTIDAYLAALARRLPRFRRRRALAEVREHLRDSAERHRASGLELEAAEAEAVRGFGDLDVVAGRFAAESAVLETRSASALALAAVALFVFPLYVVPENTLPPAQWADACSPAFVGAQLFSSATITRTPTPDDCSWPSPSRTVVSAATSHKPRDILVLQIASVALWVIAGFSAAAAAVLAWTRWSRFAAGTLGVAALALAGSIGVSAALVVRWVQESPISGWWPLLGTPLAIGCLLVCVGTARWAHSRRLRLARD